ncbi:hypothetical protein ACLE20_11265 [Rhizobium sp. YIM 134829]|uniref:hypothetical protein n=1 Tax=Rhizobium sp. YIM 134829 TaxID=3390453 RepID=UPI00397944F5
MNTVNELIVALVTGSNEASRLAPSDVTRMLDLAAVMVRQLTQDGGESAEGSVAQAIAADAARADSMNAEAWQAALRHAAQQLRHLQPDVEPDRALPAHRPDGGDGGNY